MVRNANRNMKAGEQLKQPKSADDEEPSDSEDRMIELDLSDPVANMPLLSGYFHLIDLDVDHEEMEDAEDDSYAGITAEFCKLDFALHKKDPSSGELCLTFEKSRFSARHCRILFSCSLCFRLPYVVCTVVPMFRFLLDASPGCKNGVHYKVDLKTFAALARMHDSKSPSVKALELSGVVFHESRCGSTLVANALAAMNPAENRVYSESAPPIEALSSICGEAYKFCSLDQAAQILSDVIYLMSRTADDAEKRVFFKIQSIGTRNIQVFQHAFPHTPWIFVYRDPVQVMMSQLANGATHANCVRPRKFKHTVATDLAHKKGKRVEDLSDVEYCALHLATITESAVTAMQREPHLGTPVNYVNLPDILYKDIIPNKFGVQLSQAEIDNIIRVSSVYSKGTNGRKKEFKDDSKTKEKLASVEVREASHLFLDDSYSILESGGIVLKTVMT